MRLNPEFISQQIGDSTILVPIGETAQQFHGIVQLNSTAAFIVKCLKEETNEENIQAALSAEYDGTEELFASSIREMLGKLRECGALIE